MSRSSREFWSHIDNCGTKGNRVQPDEPETRGCLLVLLVGVLLVGGCAGAFVKGWL